jgi:hypothetical protein
MSVCHQRLGELLRMRFVRGAGTVIAVLLGINLLINAALNGYVRWGLAPQLKKEKGLDLYVKALWVNLFTGTLSVWQVRVANPPGSPAPELFGLSRATVNLDWTPLLWGTIRIPLVEARGVRTTIVSQMKPEKVEPEKKDQASSGEEKRPKSVVKDSAKKPTRLPRLWVGRVRTDAVVEYVVVRDGAVMARTGYTTALKVDNFRTYGSTNTPWAAFVVTGHAGHDSHLAELDMRGTIAPRRALEQFTFTTSGTLNNADVSQLQVLSEQVGLQSGRVSISMMIDCKDGMFDDSVSRLDLRLRGVRGSATAGITLPEVDLTVPLKGTVMDPNVQILKALGMSLTKTAFADVRNIATGLVGGISKAVGVVLPPKAGTASNGVDSAVVTNTPPAAGSQEAQEAP